MPHAPTPAAPDLRLTADRGTLLLEAGNGFDVAQLPGVLFDARTNSHRAVGKFYREIIEYCIAHKVRYIDGARQWQNKPLGLTLTTTRQAHPHQSEALSAWLKAGKRGTVVLPTGTGKTYLAVMAIAAVDRPTLIVTPTLDLLRQWHGQLGDFFGTPIGALGGGDHTYLPITVTTYDSAYIHLERWAAHYGFLIFDEAHHLPGATYQEAARGALAPFRMGVTATPERADGLEDLFPDLIGPICYRREIGELKGEYLAEYETRRVYVDLSADEEEAYRRNRELYRNFLFERGISMSGANGWQRFIFEASRSPAGVAALRAYRAQKAIERGAEGKYAELEKILRRHAKERSLVFTADNATVYEIARRYLVPPITHQTKVKERRQILARFHGGEYRTLVTSQVLNEGVDVPAASVGVVLSGSGSIKENVQRLGRILRKYGDKQAVLYEIIAKGTAEEYTSDRRRQHGAFQTARPIAGLTRQAPAELE